LKTNFCEILLKKEISSEHIVLYLRAT